MDILADGSLDLKDDILKECDVVLASVHSRFNMEEGEMTRSIIKAIKNPNVAISRPSHWTADPGTGTV